MIEGAALRSDVSDRRFRGTIYYIGAFTLPAGNASTQRVRSNAKVFRDLGFRVVLVGIHEGGGVRGIERRGSFARDGFHSLSLNVGSGRFRKAARRLVASSLFRIIRMRFKAPAVIGYNHVALSQAQLQVYCRLNGIPFSPDATEWYGPSGAIIADTLRSIDTTIRMRVLNRLTDGIITTSPFLTRYYARGGKQPQVELPTLFDRAETGVGTLGEGGPLALVFAGNPFNPKIKRTKAAYWKERLDVILEILVEANKNGLCAKLDVFGVSREQCLSAFELGEEFNPHWLMFWGQVPREQVLQATKAADFTIFFREPTKPNIAGFPSKFAESITCGTPVITNFMDNIAAFARDGSNCVLMDPADRKQSAEMLRTLSNQRDRIGRMKQYCASTNPFDYRGWTESVGAFVHRWRPEAHQE